MIPKDLIKKINELAKKSKNEGLNREEIELQKKLRKKYLKLFREGFKQQLLNIKVVDENNNDITPKKIKNEKERKKENE